MGAKILSGAECAAACNAETGAMAAEFTRKHGFPPALAVVLVITRRPLLPDFAIGLLAVLVGGLVELFQKQLLLDDNLSIPLSVGLVLLLALL